MVDGDGDAGPVQEQFLAGPVLLPQDHILPLLPSPVQMTEAAVGVAVGVLFAVLLPQQLQGEFAVFFALLAERGEIRNGMLGRLAACRRGREERGPQTGLVPILAKRPREAGRLSLGQILMDGALTDVGAPAICRWPSFCS